ncbi:uncharacterized protein LOC131009178 [Salvia miltiorrhiza]|uniref:uncharacterized protein LOC131009178 n=1 Tax=Salvia miltiorrhiza TaxID=226208 RepID=UPI0025AD527A|nr:uncharacterized protein LOC131009178 [Salvia miltiorrhiza]
MSDPSSSPPQQDPLQSDAVSGALSSPLNEETPILLPDPETAPPAAAIPDPTEDNSPGEEDDDDEEGEEADEEASAVPSAMDLRIEPPITDPHVTLASPTSRRGGSKRKKGKGKGKAKPNSKRMQAINEKLQNLRSNLNPVPFIPHKILDFVNHEKLLKKLGLWEFVHIDFDRNIRVDLIAELVANYNPKLRKSYVNEFTVKVNRADLARALNLKLWKKEKGGNAGGGVEVDLDCEVLSDDLIGFIVGFVSDWVLLHEDTWMMPNEVMDWMKMIKEGHPEKVDWAALIWFMVEKELKQGGQLRNCFYASHLQHLIKCQRPEMFLMGDPVDGEVECTEEAKVVGDGDGDGEENVKESDVVESLGEGRAGVDVVESLGEGRAGVDVVESLGEGRAGVDVVESLVEGRAGVDVVESLVEGPSTELTLGGEKEEEEVKEVEMVDAENCDEEEGAGDVQEQEHEHEHEQGLWRCGKNNLNEHFLQRCGAENTEEFINFDHRKEEEAEQLGGEEDGEEEDEEEAGDDFGVFPNDALEEGDGFTGNYLQTIEANQIGFASQEQLPNASSVDDARADVQHIASTPSFFNNLGKRVIEHDYHHQGVNDSSKRLRINETWDNKPVDFGTCMEQIEQMVQRARMLHEEREQAAEQSGMNQQILLNELQKRDAVIEHLHKARLEETQKKDIEINRLERELYLIGSVLNGYRKALKDVKKAFAEYKERAQLHEEPTYKDAGPGGLMLTAAEIERRRRKSEEEYRMNCLILEQKMREVEEEYNGRFDGFVDKINLFDTRLMGLEADAKKLIASYSKKRIAETEDEEHEVAEALPVPELNGPAEEVSEALPSTEAEEEMAEAAEDDLAIPQSDGKVIEAEEPLPIE